MPSRDSGSSPPGGEDGLVSTVVRAVARAEGVQPIDLSPPLYDAIDPEALCDAVGQMDEGSITFEYHGWTVEVAADERVTLGERSAPARFELRCVTCAETLTFESLDDAQREFNAHADERHQVELVNLDTDSTDRTTVDDGESPDADESRPDGS